MILVLLYAAIALVLFPVALVLAIRAHGRASELDRRVARLEREMRAPREGERVPEPRGASLDADRALRADHPNANEADEPEADVHGASDFDAAPAETAVEGGTAAAVSELEPADAKRTLAEIHASFIYRAADKAGTTEDDELAAASNEEYGGTNDLPRLAVPPTKGRTASRTESRTPTPPIEWERWLGVRGAAILGGIAAALAGLFFYRHAVEQGWITEVRRLAGGIGVGLAMIVIGDRLRPRGYRYAPEALLGAGLVVLYGAFWAASERYGLWPQLASFLAMGLNTALACWLSLRHGSRLIATLALVGGFATPFVVQVDDGSSVGLFGYILLLDLALLFVTARSRSWSFLVPLALAGTTFVQISWTLRDLDATTSVFALVMLGVFGALFFVSTFARGRGDTEQQELASLWTLVGSLFVPFSFALYFATRVDLGDQLWPLGILVNVLIAGACVCARNPRLSLASFGAVCAATAVYATWMFGRGMHGLDLEIVLHLTLLLAIPLLALELERRRIGRCAAPEVPSSSDRPLEQGNVTSTARGRTLVVAVLAAVLGAFFLLLQATWDGTSADLWPAVLVLALLLTTCTRAGAAAPRVHHLDLVGAGVVSLGVLRLLFLRSGVGGAPLPFPSAALVVMGFALALLWIAHGRLQRAGSLAEDGLARPPEEASKRRTRAILGASAFAALQFTGLPIAAQHLAWSTGQLVLLELLLLVATLASLARVRMGAASGVVAALLPLAIPSVAEAAGPLTRVDAGVVLAFAVIGALLLAAFVLTGHRIAERCTAVASDGARSLQGFGAPAHLGLTLALGLVALVALIPASVLAPDWRFPTAFLPFAVMAAIVARGAARSSRANSLSPTVWHDHAALVAVLVGATIGLHIARFPIATTPAIVAICLTVLQRRTRNQRFVLLTTACVVFATMLLVAAAVLDPPYVAGSRWLFDELAYTHLIPAAATFFLARSLQPSERRAAFDAHRTRVLAGGCGALICFVWISLVVVRLYVEAGEPLVIPNARNQAVHLALSTSWACYALVLLAVGTFAPGRASGARWASLVVLLVAIAKVFLYDLGDLDGLRRVASLSGLAFTLLAVSFGYQRFVFGVSRRSRAEADDESEDESNGGTPA